MFVGHYGPALAGKRLEPSIPLRALFIAVQFLDVLWAPFVLVGIEGARSARVGHLVDRGSSCLKA
jgi:hypothetical protein